MKKFNIYEFFNSKAIGSHCQKIGKEFNIFESAYIIYHNEHPIEVKHEAYQWLMDNMEDMRVEENDFQPEIKSFKRKLKKMINTEKKAIEKFKMEDSKWIYYYKINEGGDWYDDRGFYSSWYKVIEDIKENKETDIVYRCEIYKQEVDGDGAIWINLNNEFDIEKINYMGIGETELNFLKDYLVYIPVPFLPGDILTSIVRAETDIDDMGSLFVIDSIESEQGLIPKKRMRGNASGDMSASIYYINNWNGELLRDNLDPFLRFEYYEGELPEDKKILKYISKAIKNKIDPGILIDAYEAFKGKDKYERFKDIDKRM